MPLQFLQIHGVVKLAHRSLIDRLTLRLSCGRSAEYTASRQLQPVVSRFFETINPQVSGPFASRYGPTFEDQFLHGRERKKRNPEIQILRACGGNLIGALWSTRFEVEMLIPAWRGYSAIHSCGFK